LLWIFYHVLTQKMYNVIHCYRHTSSLPLAPCLTIIPIDYLYRILRIVVHSLNWHRGTIKVFVNSDGHLKTISQYTFYIVITQSISVPEQNARNTINSLRSVPAIDSLHFVPTSNYLETARSAGCYRPIN